MGSTVGVGGGIGRPVGPVFIRNKSLHEPAQVKLVSMRQVAGGDACGSNFGQPEQPLAYGFPLPRSLLLAHIGSRLFCLFAPQRFLFFSLRQKYLGDLIHKAVEGTPLWLRPPQPNKAHMGIRRKVKRHEHEVLGQWNNLGIDSDASASLDEREHTCQ